jgi:hypothetical protein
MPHILLKSLDVWFEVNILPSIWTERPHNLGRTGCQDVYYNRMYARNGIGFAPFHVLPQRFESAFIIRISAWSCSNRMIQLNRPAFSRESPSNKVLV